MYNVAANYGRMLLLSRNTEVCHLESNIRLIKEKKPQHDVSKLYKGRTIRGHPKFEMEEKALEFSVINWVSPAHWLATGPTPLVLHKHREIQTGLSSQANLPSLICEGVFWRSSKSCELETPDSIEPQTTGFSRETKLPPFKVRPQTSPQRSPSPKPPQRVTVLELTPGRST